MERYSACCINYFVKYVLAQALVVKLAPTVSDGLWSGDTGTFGNLSHEMLSLVLSYLGFAEKLLFATSVCKSFRSLLQWKQLWTSIGLQVPKGRYNFGSGVAGFRFTNNRKASSQMLRIAPSRVLGPFSLLSCTTTTALALEDLPTPTMFSKVLKLDQMKSLTSLYLSGVKVNQAVANTVIAKQGATLQKLVLDENRIPQATKIKLLEACPDLRYLTTGGFMNSSSSKSSSALRTTLSMPQIRAALSNGRGGGDAKPLLEVLECRDSYPGSLQTLGEWFPEIKRFEVSSENLADLVTETPFPEAPRLTDLCLETLSCSKGWGLTETKSTSADFQSVIKKVMVGSDDASFPSLQNLTIALGRTAWLSLGTALDGGSHSTLTSVTLKHCIVKPSDFANFDAPNLKRIDVTLHEFNTHFFYYSEENINDFFETHSEEDFLAPVDNFRIEAVWITGGKLEGKLKGFTMHRTGDA